jgi:hypothetical protein
MRRTWISCPPPHRHKLLFWPGRSYVSFTGTDSSQLQTTSFGVVASVSKMTQHQPLTGSPECKPSPQHVGHQLDKEPWLGGVHLQVLPCPAENLLPQVFSIYIQCGERCSSSQLHLLKDAWDRRWRNLVSFLVPNLSVEIEFNTVTTNQSKALFRMISCVKFKKFHYIYTRGADPEVQNQRGFEGVLACIC